MTLPDALPDNLTRIRRAAGMALNRSDGFRGGRMKTPLLNGIILSAALLEPLLHGQIQSLGERTLSAARLLNRADRWLDICLETFKTFNYPL
jgi:hypothetical protein